LHNSTCSDFTSRRLSANTRLLRKSCAVGTGPYAFGLATLQQPTGCGIVAAGPFCGFEGFCGGVNRSAGDAVRLRPPLYRLSFSGSV
jgi:hypothetical protein